MKMKYFIGAIIIGSAAIGFIGLVGAADVQYPVKELGDCQDQESCESYCDKPENIEICVNFAEKNDLMSPEEIQTAKNFIAAGSNGPGGCTTKDSCEQYCNEISHIDECVLFAEENNLMSPDELAEAKQVQAAIARGVKPPACGSKSACDSYCEEPEHMEECIVFGEAAGFIKGKDLEDAQKMLAAVKRGVKPPPCRGKEACDEYCTQPENMESCMNFAMEAGFMSEQEKADAQKMLQAIKQGVRPPNCKGKDACDVYCGQEEHFEECVNFALAAGFMSEEDAKMARKTGGKGPGGCKGKDECEAFCNSPDNQETCFNFAKEHGLIPEDELRQMEEGKQKFMESIQNMPPEVYSCLESKVGAEAMAKYKSGETMPSQEIGEKMKECFEQNMSQEPEGNMSPGMGPAGCASPEECQQYCESNPEKCENFQQPEYDESKGGPAPTIPTGPSPEEINKMIEEEEQRKIQQIMEEERQRRMQEEQDRMMEQQAQQQMQEFAPPPTEIIPPPPTSDQPPQSLLESAKNFLAGLVPTM